MPAAKLSPASSPAVSPRTKRESEDAGAASDSDEGGKKQVDKKTQNKLDIAKSSFEDFKSYMASVYSEEVFNEGFDSILKY